MNSFSTSELPLYKSHKKVHALKIAKVEPARPAGPVHVPAAPNEETDGSAIITPIEERFAPFHVSREYVQKHDPQADGYFVQYADGYMSWSPADVFEDGYTLIQ